MTKMLVYGGNIGLMATVATLGLGVAMATPTSALTANVDTLDSPFVVTKIAPSKNTVSFVYNGVNGHEMEYLNLAYTDTESADEVTADEISPYLYMSRPWWAKTLYLQYMPEVTMGVEMTFEMNFDSLEDNTENYLYYSAMNDTFGEYHAGKVDYRPCVTSVNYVEGVECWLEQDESGGMQYVPYLDGVRLGFGEEEDETEPEVIEEDEEKKEDVVGEDGGVDDETTDEESNVDDEAKKDVVSEGSDVDEEDDTNREDGLGGEKGQNEELSKAGEKDQKNVVEVESKNAAALGAPNTGAAANGDYGLLAACGIIGLWIAMAYGLLRLLRLVLSSRS